MKNLLLELLGTWKGDQGIDLAPKPEIDEENPYYETLTFELLEGDIENAGEQGLVAVIYRQEVREKANDEISHSETGYWLWEKGTDNIINSFTIPRGVCVLAGGKIQQEGDEIVLSVSANLDEAHNSIAQSPFMLDKAKTLSFERTLKISGSTLSYSQKTVVDIYGKTFDHIDENKLTKIK
jgi:hypothetical protein